jgi:DNA polymerase-3 subunit alpha
MMRVMELPFEKAIRYGAKFQENENSSQVSLFGKVVMFKLLNRSYTCEDWSTMEKLPKRKR